MGLRPWEVRSMVPRDYWLITEGWNEAHSGENNEPGANAPSLAEAQELVERYG